MAQAKVINHLYECERNCPGSFYQVKALEEIYLELLKCQGIHYESHVSHFAEMLLEKVDFLERKLIGGRLMVFFYFIS